MTISVATRSSRILSLTACALAFSACAGGVHSLPGMSHSASASGVAAKSAVRRSASGAPTRLQTMAYFEGNFENTSIPASFMAANFDWTEQAADEAGASFATAFNQAGGIHAVMYAEPNRRQCSSNQPKTCHDLILAKVNKLPESSWLHLNMGSAPFPRAYAGGLQRNNTLDTRFKDMWSNSLALMMSPTSGAPAWSALEHGAIALNTMSWLNLAKFSGAWGPFVEITTDAQVLDAQERVVRYTPGNVLLEGVNYDYPLGGAYDAFLSAVVPSSGNVAGALNQDAFAVDYGPGGKRIKDGYMTSTFPIPNAWQNQQDGALAVLSHGIPDVVQMAGGSDVPHRLYGVGSFWLSYNPSLSVLWEDFCVPYNTKGCDSTWADANIVPTQPVQTATNDINALASGTVYRREFTSCYSGGASIGACVAIVNPTGAKAKMPTLTQTYTKSIVLDTKTLFQGGTVTWSATLPTQLTPRSAIILSNSP